MTSRAFIFCSLLALCLSTAIQLRAQAHPGSDATSASQASVEVFGGFSLAGGGLTGTSYGFNGGADFRLVPRVFLVADINQFHVPSPSSSNTESETVYLAGPRYLVPVHSSSRTSLFGQFLIGGDTFHNGGQAYTYEFNNATSLALSADGGVDYALSRHLGARFQGGYLLTKLKYSTYGGPVNPSSASDNQGRFAVDIVYRF
ncbi:hypothetical protein P8935_00855 [Telmatobacter sp. DSM 110680]|uniref:Outer membrane protein beta-barrel domain-containing protein n=1 Tax=Telmatobacter sp. DSM 110680 TaxID=3036704 RepID=A0AAU7DKP3_9BACT